MYKQSMEMNDLLSKEDWVDSLEWEVEERAFE